MSNAAKETIYIEIHDNSCNNITKVDASKHKMVTLLLPKSATSRDSVRAMKKYTRTSRRVRKRLRLKA